MDAFCSAADHWDLMNSATCAWTLFIEDSLWLLRMMRASSDSTDPNRREAWHGTAFFPLLARVAFEGVQLVSADESRGGARAVADTLVAMDIRAVKDSRNFSKFATSRRNDYATTSNSLRMLFEDQRTELWRSIPRRSRQISPWLSRRLFVDTGLWLSPQGAVLGDTVTATHRQGFPRATPFLNAGGAAFDGGRVAGELLAHIFTAIDVDLGRTFRKLPPVKYPPGYSFRDVKLSEYSNGSFVERLPTGDRLYLLMLEGELNSSSILWPDRSSPR